MTRLLVFLLPVFLLLASGSAWAQGNDSTSTSAASAAPGAVQIGALTSAETTTGNSGPRLGGAASSPVADRRERVLGPVCDDLREAPAAHAACLSVRGAVPP